ncbi:adipokinetic hormone/corazonin-related peptide receptor variant I-like [Panulirus ornatus]|uniref:adipokinetic hormone/corazonin-related peptide receptor variant I-like n=1 Tax=Panulirus ornatus TaxID=150431 RepID=UPI003A858D82
MMEALDALESQSEEVLLDVGLNVRTTNTPGSGTWLEQALNDSECLLAPGGVSECQPNTTLILASANTTTLPPSLGFDDNALTDIIIYSVMFVVAAVGNLTVFITLFRNRHRKSRVNLMIMHLAAADLMVTLINFPLEVGWRITTQWVAGNLACKLFQFLRAFGLYLSSLVLVCISLDRYFAIVHPLKVNDAQRRGKIMLSFAWSTAAVCSLPQSVIFHVDTHPIFKNFRQCVTFGFFRTQVEEMTYNLFCLAAMYFLPLFVIVVVYLRILWEISQKSKDSKEDASNSRGRSGRLRLRRSDMTNIERARARTLRMTVIIVLAFIWCWTPYVVIVMWYMFDRQSAEQVDKRLQDALFIMAVSNSCVNPLVYGTYTINFRNELNRCFGRKTKPPVLARKSTVMTSQDARSTRYQVRSSVTTLDPVQHQGSTAMRTTVTAQLSPAAPSGCPHTPRWCIVRGRRAAQAVASLSARTATLPPRIATLCHLPLFPSHPPPLPHPKAPPPVHLQARVLPPQQRLLLLLLLLLLLPPQRPLAA